MQIDIITAFPSMISSPLEESIIKRARSKKVVRIHIHNLRDWAKDKHKTIDDTPYGGGAGMILKVEPLYSCLKDIIGGSEEKDYNIILTSPRGKKFDQNKATQLSLSKHLIIICGHYKGVDERIKCFFQIQEISVGDYVLSGGELPALIIVDALVRLLPGVLNDIESAWTDSFSDSLLDCNYYTRPENFKGEDIPKILLSGDHKKIEEWRQNKKEEITKKNRADLYDEYLKTLK